MTPVPPGRTADPAKIDQVFDALSPLTLDDVQAADGQPPESEQFRLVYDLYDGRQIIPIFPHSDGKESFTLRVTAEESTAEPQADDASGPATRG